jgi:hypothetical protein
MCQFFCSRLKQKEADSTDDETVIVQVMMMMIMMIMTSADLLSLACRSQCSVCFSTISTSVPTKTCRTIHILVNE